MLFLPHLNKYFHHINWQLFTILHKLQNSWYHQCHDLWQKDPLTYLPIQRFRAVLPCSKNRKSHSPMAKITHQYEIQWGSHSQIPLLQQQSITAVPSRSSFLTITYLTSKMSSIDSMITLRFLLPFSLPIEMTTKSSRSSSNFSLFFWQTAMLKNYLYYDILQTWFHLYF